MINVRAESWQLMPQSRANTAMYVRQVCFARAWKPIHSWQPLAIADTPEERGECSALSALAAALARAAGSTSVGWAADMLCASRGEDAAGSWAGAPAEPSHKADHLDATAPVTAWAAADRLLRAPCRPRSCAFLRTCSSGSTARRDYTWLPMWM